MEMLAQGVDLVVATPGRLGQLLANGKLSLASTHSVVFDEADVLLGEANTFVTQVGSLSRYY